MAQMSAPPRGLTAVVLAGGASRRFGSDKALAPWLGRTLLEDAVRRALEAAPEAVIATKEADRSGLERERVRVVRDEGALRHPLSGVLAGLAACRTPWAFVFACDMPFVDAALVEGLWAERAGAEAVLPVWRGRAQPLAALYRSSLRRALAGQLGREPSSSALSFALRRRVRLLDAARLGLEAPAFLDVDDRASYERALRTEAAWAR